MKSKAKTDCELENSPSNLSWRPVRHTHLPTALELWLWSVLQAINLKDPEKDPKNKPVMKFGFPALD